MFLEWERKDHLEGEAMTDMTIADMIVVIDMIVETVMIDMIETGIMSKKYNCTIKLHFVLNCF